MNLKEIIFELLAPKPNKNSHGVDGVTLYGDSIMYGGIAKNLQDAGYTSTGKVLHDMSLPGDTAKNLWHRMPYELRSTKRVVVQQGTNDISAGVNPIPYLRKIVRYMKAEGRIVILTGISRRTDLSDLAQLQYAVEIQKLAQQEDAGYVNWPIIKGNTTDGLHPDAEMTKNLAIQLLPLI